MPLRYPYLPASRRLPHAAPLLVLLALPALLLARQLFGGLSLVPLDLIPHMSPWQDYLPGASPAHNPLLDSLQQYYPRRVYFQERVLAGELPLWNPYLYLGIPFLAAQQSAVFYPPAWLLLGTTPETCFAWSGWLHLFIAGAGMYALLRQLDLGPLAALAGGIAFQLNGFSIVWLAYPNVSQWTLSWLPLIAFLWERGRRGSVASLAATGLCLGLAILGGHGQISFYVLLAATSFILVRSRCNRDRRATSWRGALLTLGLPLALGLGLAAGHALPAWEYLPRTDRGARVPWEALDGTAFPTRQLVTFLVPRFFGDGTLANLYWGKLHFVEMMAYPGLVALMLATLALWPQPPGGRVPESRFPRAFFLGLAAAALLLAMRTPLYWPLWRFLPGFSQFTAIARILCLADWALAALAAAGVEGILSAGAEQRQVWLRRAGWTTAGIALVILAAVTGEALLPPTASFFFWPELLPRHLRMLGGAAAWPILVLGCLWLWSRGSLPRRAAGMGVVALVAADLFAFGFPFNPAADSALGRQPTPELSFLARQPEPYRFLSTGKPGPRAFMQRIPPNLPSVFGIPDIYGSDSFFPRRFLAYMAAVGRDALAPDFARPDHPLIRGLGARFLYTRQSAVPPSYRPILPPYLYEQRQPVPYARLHTRVRVVAARQAPDPLATLDPRSEALIEAPLPIDLSGPPDTTPWRTERRGGNRLVLTGNAPRGGLLVVAEGFDAGWKAMVDGRAATVVPANRLLLGVPVPAGAREVRLTYAPQSVRAGLFVSLLAAGGLLAVLLGTWRRRR
ncbi:MAG: YfhO family protein [Armatimonadetes bacterium]|nr:YfhO family protein [Armatimonadota bacterium]